MKAHADRLWQQLHTDGLVKTVQAPAGLSTDVATPWYINLMLGLSSCVGGVFLMYFCMSFIDRSMYEARILLVVGLVLVAVACAIYQMIRRTGMADFGQYFALTLSLAGQGMLRYWLVSTYGANGVGSLFAMAAFELVLIVLAPNFSHRVLSTFLLLLTLDLGCRTLLGASPVLPICTGLVALLWLDESNWQVRLRQAFLPMAVGLTLSLLWLALIVQGDGHRSALGDGLSGWLYLLDPIVVGLIFVALVAQLSARLSLARRCAALGCGLTLAIFGGWVIGLVLGAMLLLLGFARGRRELTATGIVATLGYLSWFYYSLQWTLLTKSIGLMLSGGLLLLAYVALCRVHTETKHA
ncbi:DUF4401 domain-containing protein [Glaciimonas sp. GG7]